MKNYHLNFNYLIANFISQLNIGLLRKLRFIKIVKTPIFLRILRILYKYGLIRTFRIEQSYISVYFKFIKGQPIGKFSIISRPGKRCYWRLGKLSKNFSNKNFSGFYIISSQQGLVTSNYCLLSGHVGGEVLIKVEI
jgi:ribosomal protein S8